MTHVAVLVFLVLQQFSTSIQAKDFIVGVLLPWGGWAALGSHGAGAITVAVSDINSDQETFMLFHSLNHTLDFTWADTECSQYKGLPIIPEMWMGVNFPPVDAYIGPACSVNAEPGAILAAKWAVPMVSCCSTSDKLSNKILYPTFARTTASSARSAPLYAHMLPILGYDRVALFFSSDPVQARTALAIRNALQMKGIMVVEYYVFEPRHRVELQALISTKLKTSGRFYRGKLSL